MKCFCDIYHSFKNFKILFIRTLSHCEVQISFIKIIFAQIFKYKLQARFYGTFKLNSILSYCKFVKSFQYIHKKQYTDNSHRRTILTQFFLYFSLFIPIFFYIFVLFIIYQLFTITVPLTLGR